MLYSFEEAIKKYGSFYQLNKAISEKKIYKIEKGIYSSEEFVNYLSIIRKKYPQAVFASHSAYFYHNLTDVIPSKYYLATDRDDTKIRNNKIHQLFVKKDNLNIGVVTQLVNGVEIKIYDKERMLIELIKNQNNMSFDYYKEIISNYRKNIGEIDVEKLEKYLSMYKNAENIFEKIQREVY